MTDELSKELNDHLKKFASEKESLIAKYLNETGLSPSDICLVTQLTETGSLFYPDVKSKYEVPK